MVIGLKKSHISGNLGLTNLLEKCKMWIKLKGILVSFDDIFSFRIYGFPRDLYRAENLIAFMSMWHARELSERFQNVNSAIDFIPLKMWFQDNHDRWQNGIFFSLSKPRGMWINTFSRLFYSWVIIFRFFMYSEEYR